MKIESYRQAESIEQAYSMIQDGGTVIGGGTWLKLLPKKVSIAIDISQLELSYINESEYGFEIGASTTLREIECNETLIEYLEGVIPYTIKQIMGVPFRNIATIGGTVVGRYGFSDLLTTLLALDALLVFHDTGKIPLATYLEGNRVKKDLLVKIILPKRQGKVIFKTVKKTSNDFPMLNTCIAAFEDKYNVVVGSRPGVACLANESMAFLDGICGDKSDQQAHIAGELAACELTFADNARASEDYRKILCRNIVRQCVLEVSN